ncbi:hypothetical protein E2C01_046575 [Portunus trituberculatus]|uniref:Uncharacterized protein n=1 Tax=Portunus trituberculatus TaxID=210409 RepID=A0A5B7G565_PORTR|nr:hypothetical protein [Portunus trituberculatus]
MIATDFDEEKEAEHKAGTKKMDTWSIDDWLKKRSMLGSTAMILHELLSATMPWDVGCGMKARCGSRYSLASGRVETPATLYQLSDFARRDFGQFDRLPVKYAR